MRFVPVNCIKEGMVSGRKIFGKNGELLLNTGLEIQSSYIEKLKELGYIGIYVEDDLSDDIQINEVISQTLRTKAVRTVKDAFIMLENGRDIYKDYIENIGDMIKEMTDEILSNKDLMVNLIDLKVFDDYTYFHSINVGVLSIIMGVAINLSHDNLCNLGLASILHDIGKVFINKNILNKPSKLTNAEFETIKTHSFKGYEYLEKSFDMPSSSCYGVLQHHERFDGFGYPKGAKGNKISLFGKIIAIADVYDALTSKRPYRNAIEPSEAIEYIMGGCGTLFDPELVNVFTQKIAPYPIGTCVKLSNGMSALIVENYPDCSLRPKVKIIMHGNEDVKPYYIDLKYDKDFLNVTVTGLDNGKASQTSKSGRTCSAQ